MWYIIFNNYIFVVITEEIINRFGIIKIDILTKVDIN